MTELWPEVEVEEINGSYISWTNNGSINLHFIKESVNYDNDFLRTSDMTVEAWISTLDNAQVEAGIQIFYDRWNFHSGSDSDKRKYELFEKEKQIRLQSRPELGDLYYDDGKCNVQVFDGKKWIEFVGSDESTDT